MADLSEPVRRLLASMDSVEDLEVLLLLSSQPDRRLTVAEIGQLLHTQRDLTQVLERLARLNLVAVKLAHEVLYRYESGDPAMARVVEELRTEHVNRRLLVLQNLGGIASSSSSAIRSFADAFRIRRRRDG